MVRVNFDAVSSERGNFDAIQ